MREKKADRLMSRPLPLSILPAGFFCPLGNGNYCMRATRRRRGGRRRRMQKSSIVEERKVERKREEEKKSVGFNLSLSCLVTLLKIGRRKQYQQP